MAVCKKCNVKGLKWIQQFGRWRLIDGMTGNVHGCQLNQAEYEQLKEQQRKKVLCRHGISIDRACPYCEYDRQNA